MPLPKYLPTWQVWKTRTTDSAGCRMIEARGCDVHLDQFSKASGMDFVRIPKILQDLMGKVQKGISQTKSNPYLNAQFRALHFNLLKEIKDFSRKKQQTFNPDAGRGAISLGWHREQRGLQGMYLTEKIDAQHRFGNFWGYAAQLKGVDVPKTEEEFRLLEAWTKDDGNESRVWDCLPPSMRDSYVAYLDPQGRWKYRLTPQDNKILQSNERGELIPFDTSKSKVHDFYSAGTGRGIWVYGKNTGDWYAGSHITGKFHHSSFLSGDMVICGGEIVCKNGLPLFISNKTGHYQAGPRNLYNALRRICKVVDMSGAQVALNLGGNMELWTTVSDFMSAEGLIERLTGTPVSTQGFDHRKKHDDIQKELNSTSPASIQDNEQAGIYVPASSWIPSGYSKRKVEIKKSPGQYVNRRVGLTSPAETPTSKGPAETDPVPFQSFTQSAGHSSPPPG